MSHEDQKRLYEEDVALFGIGEAFTHWEVYLAGDRKWTTLGREPFWATGVKYRRKEKVSRVSRVSNIVWPINCNFMATDADGQTRFFPKKPYPGEFSWLVQHGGGLPNRNTIPDWKDTLVEKPAPKLSKVKWYNLSSFVEKYWNYRKEIEGFPSNWIPWHSIPDCSGVNPLPDGLKVEYTCLTNNCASLPILGASHQLNWSDSGSSPITAFRVIGVMEGWEA